MDDVLKVTVVTPIPPGERDDGISIPLRHVLAACSQYANVQVITVERSPRPSSAGITGMVRGKECYASAAYASTANRRAVASATDPSTVVVGFLGSTGSLIRGIPARQRICIVQDSITNISRHNGRLDGAPSVLRRIADRTNERYERKVYSDLSAVVVTTEAEKRFLETLGVRCRIVSNPNGVDVPTRLPQSAPDADLILLGNYSDTRNLRCAQRALDVSVELSDRLGRLIRVVAVGWEAHRIATPETGVALEVLEGVPDVDKVLPRGRCFLSIDPDSTGIKNSVLRLLAAGVPGVVTEQVVAPFAMEKVGGALAVVDGSPVDAARAVERLLGSDDFWQACRSDAVELARAFSWDAYETRLVQLFQST